MFALTPILALMHGYGFILFFLFRLFMHSNTAGKGLEIALAVIIIAAIYISRSRSGQSGRKQPARW